MQSTQVLKQLFADSRQLTDAQALIECALKHVAMIPSVTAVAVLVQQTQPPHQVRLQAAQGLSEEVLKVLAAAALSGTGEASAGLRYCAVPLASSSEQVIVLCDGGVEPDTLSLVTDFLALTVERFTSTAPDLFSAGPVVVFRRRNQPGWPVEQVSASVTPALGYVRAQVLEQPYASLVHPGDLERITNELTEATKQGVAYFAQQYRVLHAGGEVRDVFDFTHVIRDVTGRVTHLHGYLFDKAQGPRADLDLSGKQQSQKLQAIGALASGVAHDFNNVLAAILAHLELARLEPALTDNIDLIAAGHSAMRGRDIVRQLLVFGRGKPNERVPHRLQRIIEDSMGMIRSTMPASVGLRLSLDPKAPAVMAEVTQLQQVLVNLVTLAANALPGQGTVEIALTTRPGNPPSAELRVTSEGPGVPAAREERGLGLSVVRTLIKAHGGTLELKPDSAVVVLPGLAQTEGSLEGSSGRQQRIALVDDEPLVARATERLVSQFGYHVTTFSSADEVLRAFATRIDAFELVLTDQTMPAMTGLELTHALRAKGLPVPVLLVTGLPMEIDVNSVAQPFLVLGKPYRSEELATGLAQLLARQLR